MKSFGELLKKFQESESPESIIPLLDEPKLGWGIAAWQSVQIKYKVPCDCHSNEIVEQWEWLWNQVHFDLLSYAIICGVQQHEIHDLFMRLKGLRLLYPNGAVNNLARQYLQSVVLARLPKKRKAK